MKPYEPQEENRKTMDNKTIELLDRAFAYDQYLGCLLTALVFLTALPIVLVLLPILWIVVLLKK